MEAVMNLTSLEAYDIINGTQTLDADIMVTSTSVSSNGTSVYDRHPWPEFLEVHSPAALVVDRAITPMWYVVGILGNLISAKIWMEKRMRRNNSSAIYLSTLSITDCLFLLLHIPQELKYAWGLKTLGYPGVCEVYFLLYPVVQYLSPLLVLGFTVERYIAVCHPFQKERYCSSGRAVKVVVCLVMLCFLMSGIQAYFWTYDQTINDCTVREEAMSGGDASLWSVWSWVTEMIVFFMVPLLIIVFNILVIREIKKVTRAESTNTPGQNSSSQNSVAATTVMLLSVAFYVIITTLPATLVYVLFSEFPHGDVSMTDAQIQVDPTWRRYLIYMTSRKFVEEICISHYACNVFLYLITGAQFRQCFVETFRRSSGTCGKGGKYAEISKNGRSTWSDTYTTHV